MRAGPRSNFSLLPFPLRCKIIFMIDDGATFAAVSSDPEVAEEYRKRGLRLTASAMTGIKKSREFRELTAKRRKSQLANRSDQLAAALLRDTGELETVSDRAKVALVKAVSELSDLSDLSDDAEKVKALRSLAQSVSALTSPAKDNRIAELKRKLREKDEEIDGKKAEIEALKAAHKEELARLCEKDRTVSDPAKVADELSHILGVKK